MDYLLNSSDVLRIAGPKTKLIIYDDLNKVNSIDELFANSTAVIILYRKTKYIGHWVGLIKNSPHLISYFDSYGYEIDKPLEWTKKNNHQLGQSKPKLSDLLLKWMESNPKNKVMYNEYPYQGLHDKDSTVCGRYVGHRLRNRKMPLAKYQRIFNQIKSLGYDPDEIIIDLTRDLF